ncbi:hypothetical protein ACFP1I_13360 [Dyadobacter subterraneus]|uniref:Glycosyltransferase RgtA/B/C/D-like domain-containing protein n=1 Tax=Dyadobacter subterraneus TaxID=2773304 RepID=A0ABR9W9R6_9BACT|nr:hypothetical protein [Dyadobacter subterraneus]MBE9462221.1 hypothetical protein [Dyadobacter subterraneus]
MTEYVPTFKPVKKASKTDVNWPSILPFISILIILARWYYVEKFAVALPFLDQWDAEWIGLLKPWTEGKLVFSDLWNSHNEHRIFLTRLMTLLGFELTGAWSNLTETRLNIILGALTPILLLWLLYKLKALHGPRWLIAAVIVAGATFPFSWENMLIGFQNQFYFLNLLSLSALALSVHRPQSIRAMIIVAMFCGLSVLTMASGLITPIVVAIVYSVDGYIKKSWSVKSLVIIFILIMIPATGYLTMPYVAGHHFLHAQNITEMVKTTIRIMGWPLTDHKLYIGLLWLPVLIIIPVLLMSRRFTRCDLLMFGCFIWTGAQVLALAYGRGHELFEVSSRYTDLLQLGLAGNAWFVIRAAEIFGQNRKSLMAFRILAIIFFGALFFSHAQRLPRDIETMKNDRAIRLIQTKNIQLYLKTRDEKILKKPRMQISYPNPEKFKTILDDPGLLKVLPESLTAEIR